MASMCNSRRGIHYFTLGFVIINLIILNLGPARAAGPVLDIVATTKDTPVTIDVLANDGSGMDAVFANDGLNRLCPGDGAGGFGACIDVGPDAHFSHGVVLSDLNGDGKLDAVLANDGLNRLCPGDGAGGFGPCVDIGPDTNRSHGVVLGDLNGDGNPDAVFANDGSNRFCPGDGAGGFGPCVDIGPWGLGVALGDLNGDGNPDAVFANIGANSLCPGDGAGGFGACVDIGPDWHYSSGVALGDLNGDGNPDAVFANDGKNVYCLGDGAGGFACDYVSADAYESWGVALGDLNGDGNPDAVFANIGANSFCPGDGAGGFGPCVDIGPDTHNSYGVALGHVANIVAIGQAPIHGSAAVNADNTITYTPDPGYTGADYFTYTLDGVAAPVVVAVTEGSGGGGVVPMLDMAATAKDTPVTIDVLANDVLAGDPALAVVAIGQAPIHGSAAVNADNTITYTPDPGYTGADYFTYTLDGVAAPVVVAVTESSGGGGVVPMLDMAATAKDTPVTIDVLANDVLAGDPALAVVAIGQAPIHGSAAVNADNTITYTPDPGYTGADNFTYTLDGVAAPVFVIVTESSGGGAVPMSDIAATAKDTPVTIDVLANDVLAGDPALAVVAIGLAPTHGSAAVNADNTITYSPDPGYTGADYFTYTLDGVAAPVVVAVTESSGGGGVVYVNSDSGGGGGCFVSGF